MFGVCVCVGGGEDPNIFHVCVSLVTCPLSRVRCHMFCVTCQVSHIRCHMSLFSCSFSIVQSGQASRWRGYERGLPHLVSQEVNILPDYTQTPCNERKRLLLLLFSLSCKNKNAEKSQHSSSQILWIVTKVVFSELCFGCIILN